MNNLVLLKQRIGLFSVAEHDTQLPLPSIHPAWRPSRPFIQACALNSPARLLYAVSAANVLIAYDLAAAAVSFTVNLSPAAAPPPSSPPAAAVSQHDDDILIPPEEGEEDGAAAGFLSLSDSVVSLHYVADLESLHVASRLGVLLSVHALTLEVTAIGDIAAGIAACSLSPDRELLAVLTSAHRLLLMTPDGERLLLDAAIAESGAGVLPTQSLQPVQPHDARETDSGAAISWRGDGQFFAVSLYHSAFRYRRIRVFSRQGEQSSQSFPFPSQDSVGAVGLSPLLCWRPSGDLITASERRVGGGLLKHEVVFFERNGLRLGEFMLRERQAAPGGSSATLAAAVAREERKERRPLPPRRRKEDDEEQKEEEAAEEADSAALSSAAFSLSSSSSSDLDLLDLSWNADSDLLALLVRDQGSLQQAVLLFSVSNYRYQLKFRFALPSSSTAELSLLWDAEAALHLLILSASGEVHSLTFAWAVDVSLTEPRWAAVVDGPTLALTPLARAIIPPPMSFASVAFPSCILALSFASCASSSSHTGLCVLCCDSTIHLLPDIDSLPRRAAIPLASLRPISLPLLSLLPSSPLHHLRQLVLLPSTADCGYGAGGSQGAARRPGDAGRGD